MENTKTDYIVTVDGTELGVFTSYDYASLFIDQVSHVWEAAKVVKRVTVVSYKEAK